MIHDFVLLCAFKIEWLFAMWKNRLLFSMAAVLTAVFAMNAEVEWLEKSYNFGTFKEADGPVTGKVRFVNKGPEATFVSRVRPSCGCTGASYTERMIEPGDTATISFTYNPTGRPGKFDKSVKVYVGKDNELSVIRILGTVIGSESTLESVFPVVIGPLRVETALLTAGEIRRGTPRHLFLNAYNQSGDTITPQWESTSPALTVDLKPRAIPPGDIATFSFYLETEKEKLNGPVEYPVEINADGKDPASGKRTVEVSAIIVPDTRKMSVEEIDNGPRAYLIPEFVDFGEVEGGKLLDFQFAILNDGKSTMSVDRVYSHNELVNITHVPKKIKAGKKGIVKGKLNPAGLAPGAFRINVEVMTNDALHPVRTARLVGNRN